MNELKYKHDVMDALRVRKVLTQLHEDRLSSFIPDLSICGHGSDGWLEVKYCETAPTHLHAIKHWTKGQEHWLIQRGTQGSGRCYLLVGCGEVHHLFSYNRLHKVRYLPWDVAIHSGWMFSGLGVLAVAIERLLQRQTLP